ncbi:MAG: GNAT family N-acetyltransferase [Ferruginibacter sp.]
MHIIFETPRLILRRFTEEDAALLLELNSDAEVLKYLHEPILETEERAREIIRDIILPQYELDLGRWAIHKKDDQQFIGWCGLKHRPELDEIDLGYRFKKAAWGNGYATEAASHTLAFGFNTLHLKTITGRANIENTASLKVLEKIGMKFVCEGIVDDCPVRTYIAVSS